MFRRSWPLVLHSLHDFAESTIFKAFLPKLHLDANGYYLGSEVFSLVSCGKFLSQSIFIFLLFLGMVMYGNEFETKEK